MAAPGWANPLNNLTSKRSRAWRASGDFSSACVASTSVVINRPAIQNTKPRMWNTSTQAIGLFNWSHLRVYCAPLGQVRLPPPALKGARQIDPSSYVAIMLPFLDFNPLVWENGPIRGEGSTIWLNTTSRPAKSSSLNRSPRVLIRRARKNHESLPSSPNVALGARALRPVCPIVPSRIACTGSRTRTILPLAASKLIPRFASGAKSAPARGRMERFWMVVRGMPSKWSPSKWLSRRWASDSKYN